MDLMFQISFSILSYNKKLYQLLSHHRYQIPKSHTLKEEGSIWLIFLVNSAHIWLDPRQKWYDREKLYTAWCLRNRGKRVEPGTRMHFSGHPPVTQPSLLTRLPLEHETFSGLLWFMDKNTSRVKATPETEAAWGGLTPGGEILSKCKTYTISRHTRLSLGYSYLSLLSYLSVVPQLFAGWNSSWLNI